MKGLSIKKLISYLLVFSLIASICTNIAFNDNFSNVSTVHALSTQISSNEYFKGKLTNENQVKYYEFLASSPTNWFDGSGKDLVYTINYDSLGITDDIPDDDIHQLIFGSNDWFDKVTYAVMRDHPEIFWVDWNVLSVGYERDKQNKTVTYSLSAFGQDNFYHKSYSSLSDAQSVIENDYTQLMQKANQIVEPTKNMSSKYDKLLYLNSWIINNNKYASDTAIGTLDNRRTAYSSIMSNNDETTGPVCVGYSYGYQLLCNLAGLDSVIVSGKIFYDKNDTIGIQHAWNRVKGDDGKWYDIDTTWNDVGDSTLFVKGYFMVGNNTDTINPTTNKIYKDNHKADSEPYPTLEDERYTVPNSDKEAFINNTAYTTVEDAFNSANVGDTITLNNGFTKNIQIENTITIDKNINLDLNGKTMMTSTTSYLTVLRINNGSTLTISDSTAKPTSVVADIKGLIQAKGTAVIENNGTCIINSGRLSRSTGGIGTTVVSGNGYEVGNNSVQLNTNEGLVAVSLFGINNISIAQHPTKTEYTYGENFNPQGLELNVNYNDLTTNKILYNSASTGFSFTPSLTEKLDISTKNITVTYTDGNSISTVQIPITVNKATPIITTKPTASQINEGQSLADSTLTGGVANVDGEFSWKNPDEVVQASGNYTAVFTPNDQVNYEIVEFDVNVQVVEQAVSVTPPTVISGLTYNGSQLALIQAGSTNRGEMQYSLSQTSNYSTNIPTAINAGTYRVWYKVVDSAGSELVTPSSVDVQISKATPNIGTVSATISPNETSATNVVLSRTDNTLNGTLSLNDSSVILQYGDNELQWTFTPNDINNYNTISGKVIVSVTDTIAPNAQVTIGENTWKQFLNKITFGLFFKETQTVKVTAEDELSGINTIEYYETDQALNLDEVKNLTSGWKEMPNGGVSITPQDAKQFVYYIKVTDIANNTTYISTNGIVFDTVAPIISGIENNKIYCNPVEVTVTDLNIESVTVNGNLVTLTDNKFTVNPANNSQTIVATDKAGNVTEYTITVNDDHEIKYTAQGNVIKESCVHGDHNETATITATDTVYTGANIQTAKVEYSQNWKGGSLTVLYENNINAGIATARITKDNATAIVEFMIEKGSQQSPSNVIGIDETIDGKNDGSIINVTTDMEYSSDETNWLPIEDVKIQNLSDGTYYVRYKETENKNASDAVSVMINAGRKLVVDFVVDGKVIQTKEVSWESDVQLPKIPNKEGYDKVSPYWDNDGKNITEDKRITAVYTINTYNVSLPEDILGYKITVDKETVTWNDSITFTFELTDGYKLSDNFKVQINGSDIDLTSGKYIMPNVKEDISVTVNGVVGLYETENTQAVKDVTLDNVKLTDEDNLTKALNDLKYSLGFANNYTEKETIFINESIARIEKALQTISNVRKVDDMLTKLPALIKPDDVNARNEIINTKQAYDALTNHEKSLLLQQNVDKLNELLNAMKNYAIIEGNNSKLNVEDNKDLIIKINGPIDLFTGLKIDGKEISKDNYTVKSGSTIVTVKSEYLKTLSVGKHTITFMYQDAEISGEFEVLANNSNNSTEQTTPNDNINNQNTNNNSDTSEKYNSYIVNTKDNLNDFIVLLLVAVLGLGILLNKKKKSL